MYLDATAFYPTSGGQPNDLGTIDGIAVTDVIDDGGQIAHVLTSTLPSPHAEIDARHCRIDWPRRFDHMQQHTGQHLLSAVLEDLFGFKTVSVHFGPDYSTLDVDAESIAQEQLVRAEQRANEVVVENRLVTVTFEDASNAIGLRKPSDRGGTIRVVSIHALDRSACGGTHVRATGEIGAVLLRSVEKIRKTMRIEFVCGARTVRRARNDFESLARIAKALSASPDDVAALVAGQAERLRDGVATRKQLEKELARYRARELYEAVRPGPSDVRTIVVPDRDSMDDLRTLALAIIALPRAVVVGTVLESTSVLVATSEDSAIDAGKILKDVLTDVGGRGGGSPRIAQGSVPDSTPLDAILAQIVSRVG